MSPPPTSSTGVSTDLSRKIGLFDATMIVIGGIVGAGIFRNPHVVANHVHSPALILGAWILGAVVAMVGAFIYAELSSTRPAVGGQYAYFREAFHPALAFVYGWALLLVVQTGGMAAVSITFADYALRLTDTLAGGGWRGLMGSAGGTLGISGAQLFAALVLVCLTFINCIGVRAGTLVQTGLTVLKMLAIGGLVMAGWIWAPVASEATGAMTSAAKVGGDSVVSLGAAMVPVLFAYGGWQTACFVGGEVQNPKRNLPRGLVLGVLGVLVMYLSVNWVCLRVLGPSGLAATPTPAADVISKALGPRGEVLLSVGIVVSTLGFLSQGMLTAPRVYFAMARDGLFFKSLATIHPKSQVPVAAIALQGVMAIVIALSGRYEAILNYVVSVDFIFYGLTAVCIFRYRRLDGLRDPQSFRIPGHPWTTLFFIGVSWWVVANSVFDKPVESLTGFAVLALGIPVYFFWRRKSSLA